MTLERAVSNERVLRHNEVVSIPMLTPDGLLPRGRFPCSLDELEAVFVDAPSFARSTSRGEIFEHFLSVVAVFESFSVDLVESVWVGGGFTTDSLNPDDIDCLFVLSGEAFDALPSNRQRAKVGNFNKKDYVRTKLELRVETFILVRIPFANPWLRGGVHPDAAPYTQVRGAWDDWWLRTRTTEAKGEPPLIESAEPRRGYLEVIL